MDLRELYTCDRLKECNTSPSCGTECTQTTDKAHAMPRYGKWIPIAERLPEENVYCLCCDKDGYMIVGFVLKGSKKWCFEADDIDIDVVAWMPLPEPPEWVEKR